MQGPGAALLPCAGALGAARRASAAWFRQEGGRARSWPRKPQPAESRTRTPAPWPRAPHTESQPPEERPGPGPASARPDAGRAGGKRGPCSPASARCRSRAFALPAYGVHAQSAADLRRFRSPHTSALDDAQSQEDEARCGPPILVGGGGEDETTWGGGNEGVWSSAECGHPDEGWRKGRGRRRPGETLPARPSPTPHLSAGSLVLWRGFSKTSHHMGRLRNARIHVERAVKVGGGWEGASRKGPENGLTCLSELCSSIL